MTDRLTAAARDVLAERKRQIDAEGWTPEHDDKDHGLRELSRAAVAYLFNNDDFWPWDLRSFKPGPTERRNLVKAGALILAEIERIDRRDEAARREAEAENCFLHCETCPTVHKCQTDNECAADAPPPPAPLPPAIQARLDERPATGDGEISHELWCQALDAYRSGYNGHCDGVKAVVLFVQNQMKAAPPPPAPDEYARLKADLADVSAQWPGLNSPRQAIAAIEALRARAEAAEADAKRLREAVIRAEKMFRWYGDLHAAKEQTPENAAKTKRNYDEADAMKAALAQGGNDG